MSDVSVIGLGAMGSALAAAFLRHGLTTTVWNRSAGKADALAARSASVSPDIQSAVVASKLVVVCLLDYGTVHEVLGGVGDVFTGRTLVNLTNGTPAQARELAKWAAKRGAQYVDGGIMAIPPMIGEPGALVLYSGSQKGFDSNRMTLDNLGTSKYLGEDAGLAALYDLSLLAGMWGMFAGAIHATALVGTEKVEAGKFMELLVPWLNAMVGLLPEMADQVDTGDYAKGVVSNLHMQAVAYVNLMEASRDQGVSPELIAPLHDLMERGVAAGQGHADLSSLVKMIKAA